jgi:hypothetical protein
VASANRLVLSAINRVVPTRALAIGIASALTALWRVYRLIWLIYTATTLSSIGRSPVSLFSHSCDLRGPFLWLTIRVRLVLTIAR